jgi:hypothetical protein
MVLVLFSKHFFFLIVKWNWLKENWPFRLLWMLRLPLKKYVGRVFLVKTQLSNTFLTMMGKICFGVRKLPHLWKVQEITKDSHQVKPHPPTHLTWRTHFLRNSRQRVGRVMTSNLIKSVIFFSFFTTSFSPQVSSAKSTGYKTKAKSRHLVKHGFFNFYHKQILFYTFHKQYTLFHWWPKLDMN